LGKLRIAAKNLGRCLHAYLTIIPAVIFLMIEPFAEKQARS
jgi:hypothetical protein